jgi:hypothetical protein
MSNHAELFNGLLEAGKALEELPQVKADLNTIKAVADQLKHNLDDTQLEVMERDETIAKLKADLAAREAELASATFREAEASAKINNLRAILGTSEPMPVVATDHVSEPIVCAKTGGLCEGLTEPAPAAEGGSKPNEAEYHAEIFAPYNGTDSLGRVWKDGKLAEIAQTAGNGSSSPLPGLDSPATTYGVVDQGQFVSHNPEPSMAEIAPIPAKPYADRPHWQKPSNMTWESWIDGGGERPYWMEKTDLGYKPAY